MCESSEYTKNTRSCTIAWTGHDRRLYNQYRSLPTTLYTSYTIMCESSKYTKNTRSCTITTDGFINVSHYYWGSGRPASVSDTTTTAVLCPPSGLSSVFTYGFGPTQYNRTINIRLICDCIIPAYRASYDKMVLSCYANTLSPIWNILHNNTNQSGFLHIHTQKGPSAS